MIGYRRVYQCKNCKKVYTEYWKEICVVSRGIEMCHRCGSVGTFKRVIAKPKLFRLRGWKIKEEK